MSTVAAKTTRATAERGASRSSRLVAALTRAPATVLLAVVAILWLVPTIGLLVSSFRTAADNAESGWWTVLTAPAQLSLQPYRDLLDDPTIVSAFINTVLITVPSALLVVVIGLAGRLRLRVDALPRARHHLPGRRGTARRAAAGRA